MKKSWLGRKGDIKRRKGEEEGHQKRLGKYSAREHNKKREEGGKGMIKRLGRRS